MANVKLTLREYIHFLNATEEDRDLAVDYVDDAIAVCGGEISLTPCGMKQWGDILDLTIEDGCIVGSASQCEKAWDFLCALAGYCPDYLFLDWFEGPDRQYI